MSEPDWRDCKCHQSEMARQLARTMLDLDKTTSQRNDLLAACEELLTTGLCDLCYENSCGFGCRCRCHQREEEAKQEARNAIARAKEQANG